MQMELLEPTTEWPNGLIPRPYQSEALHNAFALWKRGVRGVLVRQPTGTGKTVVGSLAAHWWTERGPDYHVLVLANQRTLVRQFAGDVLDLIGVQPGIEMEAERVHQAMLPRVIVASRQSLISRQSKSKPLPRFEKFSRELKWLVICDEAHRYVQKLKQVGPIYDWFSANSHNRWLGLTATPFRKDKISLNGLFPEIAHDYRMFDPLGGPCSIGDGWTCGFEQKFITLESVDLHQCIPEGKTEFDDGLLSELLTQKKQAFGAVKAMLDLVGERRTIVFCPARKQGQLLRSNEVVANLINHERETWDVTRGPQPGQAVWIDSTLDDHEQALRLQRHRIGQAQFLCVVGQCMEGYNDPYIQCVCCLRPTTNISLAEQMRGRGVRVWPGTLTGLEYAPNEERLAAIAGSLKPNCLLIDLVGISGLGGAVTAASLLANGLPDAVVMRANELAMELAKRGETVDLQKTVQEADTAVKREERLKKRAELEAIIKSSLAKIRAEVAYSVRNVGTNHTAKPSQKTGGGKGPRMLYGKHRGKLISAVSTAYLEKFLEGVKPYGKGAWFHKAITNELARRK